MAAQFYLYGSAGLYSWRALCAADFRSPVVELIKRGHRTGDVSEDGGVESMINGVRVSEYILLLFKENRYIRDVCSGIGNLMQCCGCH